MNRERQSITFCPRDFSAEDHHHTAMCNGLLRKPNFFILGAPRCGTTSLAAWLGEHPNIFMAPQKEPHFFNTDDRRDVTTLDQYEGLFRGARTEHVAVGEASVWYLSSSEAVKNIIQYNPDSRFIVMVRNPIEMAPALHSLMLFYGFERVYDFSEAWNLEEERHQGRRLPAASWGRRFLYGHICCLGAQLKRLLSIVPASRVLVVILDDLRADPRSEYLRVLNFLGVQDDERLEFPTHNAGFVLRWPTLVLLFRVKEMTDHLGINGLGLWAKAQQYIWVRKPRGSLSPDVEAALKKYFSNDVELLGRLVDRDLRAWLA